LLHIALLRAVNLGAHNKVGKADLVSLMTALGLQDGKTLLQSGNMVFRSSAVSTGQLEQQLESAAAARLGLATDVFVRTAREWQAIVEANPFPKEAKADPSHLVAVLLKSAPAAQTVDALQQAIKGREVVRAKGRCAYIVYPDGIGRSKLTSAMIEKMLTTRGTARNWNTVLRLAQMVE
jgi:uncharacterized protein (DUF1697 family)